MRRSPSIVPRAASRGTYLVLDDFGGPLGRAWRETDEEDTNRETLIRDLMEGHYRHPMRIIAFNTAEGWSRDVTMDIADETPALRGVRRGASLGAGIPRDGYPVQKVWGSGGLRAAGDRIVDHEINAEEAVRAYHGALEKLGIKPLRALSDDMKLTGTMMRYR